MEEILLKVKRLILMRDKISPEIIKEKNIKPGLRNPDGTGVIVGITTKGRVVGYETEESSGGEEPPKVIPIHGRLYYCGYDIGQLVESNFNAGRFGFEETIFLLMTGDLPGFSDLDRFSTELHKRARLTDIERRIIMGEVENHNQMYALHSVISHLSRCDANPDTVDVYEESKRCVNLIAKAPIIVAHNYNVARFSRGDDMVFVRPKENLSIAENFLYMLHGKIPDREDALIFDACLTLHAEHGGGNNSTFTVRTVSSSGANTYMAIAAGIASLSGQFHGGANESVMCMMEQCKKNVNDWHSDAEIRDFLEQVLAGETADGSGKIYGLGHAVYTLSDPRAVILKRFAKRLAEKHGKSELFNLFERVENIGMALVHEKTGAPVCVNVDFYSGLVYHFLGIPESLFTPIFAMSRIVGWSAHRLEQIIQGKIIRPAYISPDYVVKNYCDIEERS